MFDSLNPCCAPTVLVMDLPPEALALNSEERRQLARLLNDVEFLNVISEATNGEVDYVETPDVPPQVLDRLHGDLAFSPRAAVMTPRSHRRETGGRRGAAKRGRSRT